MTITAMAVMVPKTGYAMYPHHLRHNTLRHLTAKDTKGMLMRHMKLTRLAMRRKRHDRVEDRVKLPSPNSNN